MSQEMMKRMMKVSEETVTLLVKRLSEKYGFDETDAMEYLGEKPTKKTSGSKLKPSITLPWTGEVSESWCLGIRVAKQLYSQCVSSRLNGSDYCNTCKKIDEDPKRVGKTRLCTTSNRREWLDDNGKTPQRYAIYMKKNSLSREEVEIEAALWGMTIPADEYILVSKSRGRPRKTAATSDTDSSSESIETPETMPDLYASLLADVEGELSETENEEREAAKKEEREAGKAAKLAEKEEREAAEKEEREAGKAAKLAEKEKREAAKEAREAGKAAKQAEKEKRRVQQLAEKEKREAAKEAREAGKAAKQAEKEKREAVKLAEKEKREAAKESREAVKQAAKQAEKEKREVVKLAEKEKREAAKEAAKAVKLVEKEAAKQAEKEKREVVKLAEKEKREAAKLVEKEGVKQVLNKEKGTLELLKGQENHTEVRKEEREARRSVVLARKAHDLITESDKKPETMVEVNDIDESTIVTEEQYGPEVETERVEYFGTKYLKDSDNYLYDPETADPIGKWDSDAGEIIDLESDSDAGSDSD